MSNAPSLIDPTAGGSKAAIALALRPIDLAGKVVGLLDNTKEQADIILDAVADVLRERYGVARVVKRRKEFFSRPATDALINEMAEEVHVAVAALGGWGSCTLCSVHDTVEFEKRGIPATMFLTQVFRNAAVYQFRSKGMDGHPYIELPHPVSNLTERQMREVTLRHIDEMMRQLTA